MKVKFCNNNHANIHSKVVEVFDTKDDLGFEDEEWAALSEEDKSNMVMDWGLENFEAWIEEGDDE